LGGRREHGTPLDWRLFVEQERTADIGTDFSVLGNNTTPNIAASAGTYYGGALRFRPGYGENPEGFRIFSDLRLEAASRGDSSYGRGALDVSFTKAVGSVAGALTLSGGSSAGALPSQRRWYLGGAHTIRGQSPDTSSSGSAYWMTRAELGRSIFGPRAVVFGDLGWVGDRSHLDQVGRPLSGTGAGLSLLDGLIRFDVARGIHPRQQWRVDVYIEAIF
jgi:hemolysin activation/secretion protein